METNVQIILIVAIAVVIIVTLFLNRGRLKRLGIKAGNEGFEVDAQMTDDNQNVKPDDSSSQKKAIAEQIHQEGDRDEIQIDADDITARDIKQKGNDNKINIGKK
ncbi:MAG: hypothetical protein CV087_22740 [Candidatus Brocadia sp. WS118]|nr:MAG: hypothetical protein CV087_22740 [Candidatus Brocadia sp. WS118]